MSHISEKKSNFTWRKKLKSKLKGLNRKSLKKPIYVFSHHKTGTVLAGKILAELSELLNLKLCKAYGYFEDISDEYDIVLFEHSLVSDVILAKDFVGMHIIRDPRDIIVSGYQYHKHTSEAWCTFKSNEKNLSEPVTFPSVPYSREHCTNAWKQSYIKDLDGKSYQEHLLALNKTEGLKFEIDHYGSWTLEDLSRWDYNQNKVIEVKMEDVLREYDKSFLQIFDHFGFEGKLLEEAIRISTKHDLNRMSAEKISQSKHIHGKPGSKWKEFFNEETEEYFNNKYSTLLSKLEY